MFTFTCPQCRSEVSLPVRRLLVHVDADRAAAGELLFTCLGCHASPALEIDAATVAAVVRSGVTYLSLSQHRAEHPEH